MSAAVWSPVRQRCVTYKHTGNVHAHARTHAHLKGWALQIALNLARTHAQQTFTEMQKGQESTTGKNTRKTTSKTKRCKMISTIQVWIGWNSFSHSTGFVLRCYQISFLFFFFCTSGKRRLGVNWNPQDKPKVRWEEKVWNLKGCPFRWSPENAHGECFSWSLRSRPL